MFNFFRKEKMLYVIKLFAVVDYLRSKEFKVSDVLDHCILSIKDEITDVSWNYGAKEWKKYDSFKKYIVKNVNETVALDIYSAEKYVLSFDNALLNLEHVSDKQKGIIEISIYLDELENGDSFLINFFREMIKIEVFNYGYVCHILEKKSQEQRVVVDIKQTDISTGQFFDIENGYIKDLYQYNILNKQQLMKLNNILCNTGVLHTITDDLSLLILKEKEINLIKSLVHFPLVNHNTCQQ